MPQLVPITRLAAALLIVASAAVACTGDDDDGTAAPSGPASSSSPATTSATPSSEPPTSTAGATTTVAPLPPVAATRAIVAPATDDGSSATADQLMPAANGRGFLLVGARQARPGERWTATLWESGDAEHWTQLPSSAAFETGASSHANAGAWVGGELVIGGSTENDASLEHPAVWSAPDGWTFGAPTDPFGGVPGSVVAVVPGPSGPIAGGMADQSGDRDWAAAVAVRSPSGWTHAFLPVPEGSSATLLGMAANASVVVATGSLESGGSMQAAAWTSVDGGLTFEPADVTMTHDPVGTSLGAIVAVPSGFAALACTATPTPSSTALVTSPDGRAWRRAEIVATSWDGTVASNGTPACSSLQADGDRVLAGKLSRNDGSVVSIGLDGVGEWLWSPQGAGRIAEDAPLVARRTDGQIGVVSRETRGFVAGLADVGSTPSGTGLPVGRPETVSIGVVTLDGRVLAHASRYPIVRVGSNITFFTERSVWAVDDAGTWNPAPAHVVPEDATFAVDGDGVDVAFGIVEDPADAGRSGPALGTTAWARVAGEAWTPVGLVASGPGGDRIERAIATPGGFVAIGTATTSDDAGVTTSRPLATASADGRTWTAESPPGATDGTSLDELCPLADGSVLAVGTKASGSERAALVVHRATSGVWTEIGASSLDLGGEPIDACALVAGTTVIIATDDSGPTAYGTTDASTFTASPIHDASMVFRSAVTSGEVLYAGGALIEDDGNVNGALWRTVDGDTWQRIPLVGLDGPGEQIVTDITVARSGALVLAGFDRDVPVTWTVSPP